MRGLRSDLSGPLEAGLRRLDGPLGFGPLALALLPVTLLLLLPVGWGVNEETNFLFAHKTVEPAAFSPYSAVFDDSSHRFLSDWILGVPIVTFG